MEQGVHLVGCSCCSEVVWAGYEMENDDHECEDFLISYPSNLTEIAKEHQHGI